MPILPRSGAVALLMARACGRSAIVWHLFCLPIGRTLLVVYDVVTRQLLVLVCAAASCTSTGRSPPGVPPALVHDVVPPQKPERLILVQVQVVL